ncbi:hypothetical protein L1987_68733 [Smallanthus sonchifolius]|uniref:Uncharacterized protein n=1 Tax=Smallanthus sonchifolius TaxID=185202 RepID=A0ACB9B6M1_9ASTR|nr:hypothetical protein L1987_68733 [Smallanthus sonchifolius]
MRRRAGIGGLQAARNDIHKNPAFRSQFHEMCAKIGVDPLASNKGFQFQSIAIANIHEDVCVFLNHQVIRYQISRVILELH